MSKIKQKKVKINLHDWIEDFLLDRGKHISVCTNCGMEFRGIEGRIICKKCSLEITGGKK